MEDGLTAVAKEVWKGLHISLKAAAAVHQEPQLQHCAVVTKFESLIKVIMNKVAVRVCAQLDSTLEISLRDFRRRLTGDVQAVSMHRVRNFNLNLGIFKSYGKKVAEKEGGKAELQAHNKESLAQIAQAVEKLERLLHPDQVCRVGPGI